MASGQFNISAQGDITSLHIKTVADLIGSRWWDLGVKLGISFTELEDLSTPISGGPTQYAARMLNKWYEEHASMSTEEIREVVVEAVKQSGREDIANIVNAKLRRENDIQKVFQEISRNLTNDWRTVGLYLGIAFDKLDAAKASSGLDGNPRLQMIEIWQQRTVPKEQRYQLITALTELGLRNIIIAIEDLDKTIKSRELAPLAQISAPSCLLSSIQDRGPYAELQSDNPGEDTWPKTLVPSSDCLNVHTEEDDSIKPHIFLDEEAQEELRTSGQLGLYDKYPTLTDEDFESILGIGINYENYILKCKKLIDKRVGEVTPAGLESGEFTCVLVGKMGTGKSSLGNLLLDKEEFTVSNSAASVTHLLQSKDVRVGNVKLNVFDSPGLRDLDGDEKLFELRKILEFAYEGVDCFIITMNMATSRIDAEDLAAFDNIEELYGKEVYKHATLVFTHGKEVEKKGSLQKYIDGVTQVRIREVLELVENRVIAIENKAPTMYEHGLYREKLFQEILRAIKNKQGGKYTNDLFEETKALKEEKKRKQKELAEQRLQLIGRVNLNIIQLVQDKIKEKSKYEDVSVIMNDMSLRKNFIDKIYNILKIKAFSQEDMQEYIEKSVAEVRQSIEKTIQRAGDLALRELLESDVETYARKTFQNCGDFKKTSDLLERNFRNHQHLLNKGWLSKTINHLKNLYEVKLEVEQDKILKGKIIAFLKENIHMCSWNTLYILDAFKRKFPSEESKANLSDYLTECINSWEVQFAKWLKEDDDSARARQKALLKVEECFSRELRQFVSKRAYLKLVEHKKHRYQKHMARFVAIVKQEMPSESLRHLDDVDIQGRIVTCLDKTVDSLMDASFLDKLAKTFQAWLKMDRSQVDKYVRLETRQKRPTLRTDARYKFSGTYLQLHSNVQGATSVSTIPPIRPYRSSTPLLDAEDTNTEHYATF